MSFFRKLSPIDFFSSTYASFKRTGHLVLNADNLKSKVFRGGVWIGGGQIADQAARFGRNMILTRLLAPESFGVMAIILSAISVIQSFTDIGVREGLVQHKSGDHDDYVNAAWWLALSRGFALAMVVVIAAPYVARFYQNASLTGFLRVASIAIILEGALSPRSHVAMKHMKFGKLAAISGLGGLCGTFVTITLGFLLHNTWALVLGVCSESAAKCILSFVLCPYLPMLRWNREAGSQLMHFSRGLFGLSFLNLVFARADIFVLAKILSASSLGYYSMAVYLIQNPASFIITVLGQILLPFFSQIRDNIGRTNRVLGQILASIGILGLPTIAFIALFGHSLLAVAYGPHYAAMATTLTVASVGVLINVLNAQITTVFYAHGTPNLHRRAVFAMAVVMVLTIYPFAKEFGVVGAQLASLAAVFVGFLLQALRLRKITGFRAVLTQGEGVTAVLAVGIVVGACLLAHSSSILTRPPMTLLLGIASVVFAYLLCGRMLLQLRILSGTSAS
jgi:PST family polysaccharide transporter/lipopolysaccharide exporter